MNFRLFKSWKRPDILKILAAMIIIAAIAHLFLLIIDPRLLPSFLRPVYPDHPKNILIMGTDIVYDRHTRNVISESGLTDTLMIIRIDPKKQQLNVLSIPRDTPVEIPGYGTRRINMAHLIGGPELARYTVSKLTGVKIDNYVTLSPFSLIKLVDLIGGIKVYVDKDMHYVDKAGHLYIDLKKGWQVLDGAGAHDLLRYRLDPLGDINRVQRQQAFMETLLKGLKDPVTLAKIPWIIGIAREYVKTDLLMEDILSIGHFARCLKKDEIRMLILPGSFPEEEGEACFWFPDKERTEYILHEYFDKGDAASIPHPWLDRPKVSIFNNGAEAPIVWKIYNEIHKKYEIVNVKNIDRADLAITSVVAQKGDKKGAGKLAKLIGIEEVVVAGYGDVISDFTIIICKDRSPAPAK